MTVKAVTGLWAKLGHWADVVERVVWTAIQVLGAEGVVQAANLPQKYVPLLAAAFAVIKGVVAKQVGDPTASLPSTGSLTIPLPTVSVPTVSVPTVPAPPAPATVDPAATLPPTDVSNTGS